MISFMESVARFWTALISSDSKPFLIACRADCCAFLTSSEFQKVVKAFIPRDGIDLKSSLFIYSVVCWTSLVGAALRSCPSCSAETVISCWRCSIRSVVSCWICSIIRFVALLTSPSSKANWCLENFTASKTAVFEALERTSPFFPPNRWVDAYPKAAPINNGE